MEKQLRDRSRTLVTSNMVPFFIIVNGYSLAIVNGRFILDAIGSQDLSLIMTLHLAQIYYQFDIRLDI